MRCRPVRRELARGALLAEPHGVIAEPSLFPVLHLLACEGQHLLPGRLPDVLRTPHPAGQPLAEGGEARLGFEQRLQGDDPGLVAQLQQEAPRGRLRQTGAQVRRELLRQLGVPRANVREGSHGHGRVPAQECPDLLLDALGRRVVAARVVAGQGVDADGQYLLRRYRCQPPRLVGGQPIPAVVMHRTDAWPPVLQGPPVGRQVECQGGELRGVADSFHDRALICGAGKSQLHIVGGHIAVVGLGPRHGREPVLPQGHGQRPLRPGRGEEAAPVRPACTLTGGQVLSGGELSPGDAVMPGHRQRRGLAVGAEEELVQPLVDGPVEGHRQLDRRRRPYPVQRQPDEHPRHAGQQALIGRRGVSEGCETGLAVRHGTRRNALLVLVRVVVDEAQAGAGRRLQRLGVHAAHGPVLLAIQAVEAPNPRPGTQQAQPERLAFAVTGRRCGELLAGRPEQAQVVGLTGTPHEQAYRGFGGTHVEPGVLFEQRAAEHQAGVQRPLGPQAAEILVQEGSRPGAPGLTAGPQRQPALMEGDHAGAGVEPCLAVHGARADGLRRLAEVDTDRVGGQRRDRGQRHPDNEGRREGNVCHGCAAGLMPVIPLLESAFRPRGRRTRCCLSCRCCRDRGPLGGRSGRQ